MRYMASPWLAIVLVLSTAGCVRPFTQQPFDASPAFGDATNQNAAVMIGNPQPARAQDTVIDQEGKRALLAITRYQTGTTIPPQPQSTTAGVSTNQ